MEQKIVLRHGFLLKKLYNKNMNKIIVSREAIELLTTMNCDHVIFSGDPEQHCDKKDSERGACCNSCWTRRWAIEVLKNNKKE